MTDNRRRSERAENRLEEFRERARYLEALSRTQTAIANEESLEQTLSVVTESAVSLLSVDAAMVLLLDRDQRTLVPKAPIGLRSDEIHTLPLGLQGNLAYIVIQAQKPVKIDDTAERPEIHVPTLAGGEHVRALAVMPICRRDESLGVLQIYSAVPRCFSDADMASLAVLADSISVAIVHAQTYEESFRERTKLETALETVPSGALIIEVPDGRVTLANKRLGEFFLFKVEVGMTISQLAEMVTLKHPNGSLIPLDDLPVMRAFLHGERIDGEEMGIVRPDGKCVTALANAAPLRDEFGKIYGAIGEFEDVTQMKEAQHALQIALDKERRISVTLQTALLPDIPERIDRLVLSAAYRPGYVEDYVGGDFYDVFSPSPGYVGIVIGDVSGKGIAGAVRTALSKYTLRGYAYEDPSPASVVKRLNNTVATQIGTEYFVTLFYGLFNLTDRALTFANAGHEPPLLLTHSECRFLELTDGGTPIGVMGGREYVEKAVRLNSGDRVLLYTDGVTEARGFNGFFGTEALKAFFVKHSQEPPQEFTTDLIDRVVEFSEGHLRDDVAILLVCLD